MGHPVTVEDLLASLAEDSGATARSAEASLVARLSGYGREKVASEMPAADDYDNLSLEELTQLAKDRLSGSAKVAEDVVEETEVETAVDEALEATEGTPDEEEVDDLDKTAAEKAAFGAQVAAHAFMQEIELIKQANALGLCRFCKEAEVLDGQSFCTSCGTEAE
jgi:hypothetical protein